MALNENATALSRVGVLLAFLNMLFMVFVMLAFAKEFEILEAFGWGRLESDEVVSFNSFEANSTIIYLGLQALAAKNDDGNTLILKYSSTDCDEFLTQIEPGCTSCCEDCESTVPMIFLALEFIVICAVLILATTREQLSRSGRRAIPILCFLSCIFVILMLLAWHSECYRNFDEDVYDRSMEPGYFLAALVGIFSFVQLIIYVCIPRVDENDAAADDGEEDPSKFMPQGTELEQVISDIKAVPVYFPEQQASANIVAPNAIMPSTMYTQQPQPPQQQPVFIQQMPQQTYQVPQQIYQVPQQTYQAVPAGSTLVTVQQPQMQMLAPPQPGTYSQVSLARSTTSSRWQPPWCRENYSYA